MGKNAKRRRAVDRQGERLLERCLTAAILWKKSGGGSAQDSTLRGMGGCFGNQRCKPSLRNVGWYHSREQILNEWDAVPRMSRSCS